VLYRIKQARELLARTRAPGFVVGEGYLDVIAFERAGIAAVAPCGTALTEDQLQLLWRSGGEPTLCFDGDDAGRRAADRTMDLALPHLAPGRTLKIAYAPQGQDPDDIYRAGGADALTALLEAAVPFSTALFDRELVRHGLATPEARAALQAALKTASNTIADKDTSKAYFYDMLGRANAAMRAQRPAFEPRPQAPPQGKGPWKRGPQILPPTAELKAQAAAGARPAAENFLRAAADFPRIMARYADWLDRLEIADADLDAIRTALMELSDAPDAPVAIDREALSLHLQRSGRERAAARISAWPKPVSAAEGADVEAEWLALVTREVVLPAIREELSELRMAAAEGDEAAFARFQGLSREAQKIEARAREAKLDDVQEDNNGGLVA
jgi:DNA primase